MTDKEYQIKQLGSYLQDLGRYMIEHTEKIEAARITYNPSIDNGIYTKMSYISYENPAEIIIEVATK